MNKNKTKQGGNIILSEQMWHLQKLNQILAGDEELVVRQKVLTPSELLDASQPIGVRVKVEKPKSSKKRVQAMAMFAEENLNHWCELFLAAYRVEYNPSGYERGRTSTIAKETTQTEWDAAVVACFFEMLSNPWWLSKNIIPSIRRFVSKFDDWKARGALLAPYMSSPWYFVNKAGVSPDRVPFNKFVVMSDKDASGRVNLWVLENKKIVPMRIG